MDIFRASAEGNIAQLECILAECPHDIDVRNWLWQTPLMVACISNQYEAAEFLIQHGADLLASDHESGWTSLHHCMYRGHYAIAGLIVKSRHPYGFSFEYQTPTKTPMSGSSSKRRSKTKLKRGEKAYSRHGFSYRVQSPLELTDYNDCRPYDLMSTPVIHGGTFKCLQNPSEAKGGETENYVYSFGIGTNYQLGYVTQHSHQVKPRRIEDLNGKNVMNLSTDISSSFAVTSTGEIYSWGLGHGGRLGLSDKKEGASGKRNNRRFQILPGKMEAFRNQTITTVESHGGLASAVTRTGKCYVWGSLGEGVDREGTHQNVEKGSEAWVNLSPTKIQIGVRIRSVSVCSTRVLAVGVHGKLYLIGKSITDGFHPNPYLLKEYGNVKQAECCLSCLLALTHAGEVFQQDQGVSTFHKIVFPKCMGYEKQVLVQKANNSPGVKGVRMISVSADASGRHALAVSALGNVYAWRITSTHPTFPVPSTWAKGGVVQNLAKSPKLSPNIGPQDSPVLYATPPVLTKRKSKSSKNRTVGVVVSGLSRVFVIDAKISATHACVVTAKGDLYTWGNGCIGHGKQTITLNPTRVHRLRQIHRVELSGMHTLAIQRILVPTSPDADLGSVLYTDRYAVTGRQDKAREHKCDSLLDMCQRKLCTSTLVNATNVFKMFKLAFSYKLIRVLQYCIRFILLNNSHLIPLALKTLNRPELEQLDFYCHLWSTNPLADLSDGSLVGHRKKFRSHLHEAFYDNTEVYKSTPQSPIEEKRKSPSPRITGLGLQGAGLEMEDIIEMVTDTNGKKHARVSLRVRRRFRDLRKKLKQVQNLKQKIEPLNDQEKKKVQQEEKFTAELNAMRKALSFHGPGRNFLEKMKGGDTMHPSPSPPQRTRVSRSPEHPLQLPPSARSSPPLHPNTSTPASSRAASSAATPMFTPTPKVRRSHTAPANRRKSADAFVRRTPVASDCKPTRQERTLSAFEMIQKQQRDQAVANQKPVTRSLFGGNAWGKPKKKEKDDADGWCLQTGRRSKKTSPSISPRTSDDANMRLTGGMDELWLPKPLNLADFLFENKNKSAASNGTKNKNRVSDLRQDAKSCTPATAKSWGVFSKTTSNSTPKSLLDIQKEQKNHSSPNHVSGIRSLSMSPNGRGSPDEGPVSFEELYAPPPLSLSDFVKAKLPKTPTEKRGTGNASFSWNQKNKKPAQKSSQRRSNDSAKRKSMTLTEIMNEQRSVLGTASQPANSNNTPSAWLTSTPALSKSLEDIQSAQLIETYTETTPEARPQRRRRNRNNNSKPGRAKGRGRGRKPQKPESYSQPKTRRRNRRRNPKPNSSDARRRSRSPPTQPNVWTQNQNQSSQHQNRRNI